MTKERFKVTGPTGYRGHKPGDEFEASLSDDEKRRAVERGSIRPVVKRDSGSKGKGKDDG